MNPNLLQDILNEGNYPAFRENLLREVASAARRRRLARLTRHLALAACLVLAAGILFAPRPLQTSRSTPVAATGTSVPILHTVPLRPSQILETHSSPNLVFTTDQSHRLPSISDDELLALFPRHSRGLAATAQGAKRFFFLDPADVKTFSSSN
jgi:hypothetical protein